jgi:ribulose-phosphate 3-epimerase
MKTIIAPSLLACDFLNIERELDSLKGIDDLWLHLDVMDGHFVPNLTFGHEIIKRISAKTDIPLDVHLMVDNPEFYVETLKDFGIHNLTFHLEATGHVNELIAKAKEHYPSVGISIKPNTQVEDITDSTLEMLDLFLMMSVEPGFGGQSFIENTYLKLNQLTQRLEKIGKELVIQVDGGVGNQNATQLREHGCSNLVAGSYIFKGDYLERINSLRN